jgi:hypothetical protein
MVTTHRENEKKRKKKEVKKSEVNFSPMARENEY